MSSRRLDDFSTIFERLFYSGYESPTVPQNQTGVTENSPIGQPDAQPSTEGQAFSPQSTNSSQTDGVLQQLAENSNSFYEEPASYKAYRDAYAEVFRFLFNFLRQQSLVKQFRSSPQDRLELTQIARRSLDDEAAAQKMSIEGAEARRQLQIEERIRQEQLSWRFREERIRLERSRDEREL